MNIAVVLPTFNEAESLGEMIRRIRLVNKDYEIYVVDSNSTDGTPEIAKQEGIKLISLNERGKGIAIKKAFSLIESDILVLLDSDASYLPEEIPKIISALDKCDVVVGTRFKGKIEKGAMRTTNKLGNVGLTTLANVLYWKPISDVCSGFWAFRKNAYKKMTIDARHFELEANFYVECAKKKLGLCQVPITYVMRKGETKLNILHGLDIGGYLITRRVSGS
jgi:dolichol-phosphate mannosyltransferase